MSVKVGSVTIPISTGNQAYTGVGFTPKAVILWCTDLASDLATEANGEFSFGIGVSSTSRAAVCYETDGDATSADTNKRHTNTKCVTSIDDNQTVQFEGDLVSFDADGFTINWTTVQGVGSLLHYMALGGASLTNASLVQGQAPAVAEATAYTGAGFQPDCIIVFSIAFATAPDATTTGSQFGLGFAKSASSRACWGVSSEHLADPTDTYRSLSASAVIDIPNFAAGNAIKADLTSMDSDGFTLTYSATTSGAYFWALCLKGGSYYIGQITQKLTNGSQAYTGVGFRGQGVFFSSAAMAAAADAATNNVWGMGAASSATEEASVAFQDFDGQGTTVVDMVTSTTNCTLLYAGSTLTALGDADFTTFGNDGFTLNWENVDGNAYISNVLVMEIGGGSSSSGGGGRGGGGGGGGGSGGGGKPPGGGGGGGRPDKNLVIAGRHRRRIGLL